MQVISLFMRNCDEKVYPSLYSHILNAMCFVLRINPFKIKYLFTYTPTHFFIFSIHSVNSRPVACNCAGPVQHIDVSSSNDYGDKGIYYLPVDSAPKRSILIPFSEFKFNVQNPVTNIIHKPNLEGLQLYGKHIYLPELKSQSRGPNRTKKHQQSNAYNKDTQTTSSKPLYIDIQIRKTETSETFSREPNTGAIYQGKDKYLEECLDIHAVLHSRRSNTIPELRRMWSAEKLDKYVNLSDAELLKESNEKCSHPNDVVKQSINEIKQSLPTKLGSSQLNVKNTINHHSYSKVSSILPDMSLQIKSTSTGNIINIDNSGTSTSVVTNEEHNISTNGHKSNAFKMVDDSNSPVDWTREVNANNTETLKSNLENVSTISASTSPIDDTTIMKTLFTTNQSNSIPSIEMKGIQREDNNSSEIFTANPIHNITTNELTGIVTDIPINQYYGNVTLNNPENTERNDSPKETSPFQYTTDNMAVQTSTTELAVTKTAFRNVEFQNIDDAVTTDSLFVVAASASTTTPSSIPAYVVTKSSRDEDVSNEISSDEALTPSSYEMTTEVNINLNGENSNSETLEPKLMKDASVTGSIYFNFGNQNIPARFIQDPEGHVKISIDIIALCDKLNLSSNGSVLIGVMCKCVQSKTCT